MNEFKDIRDDQIRIIGADCGSRPSCSCWWWLAFLVLAVIIAGVLYFLIANDREEEVPVADEQPLIEQVQYISTQKDSIIGDNFSSSLSPGYTEITDTVINDVPLKLYIPHNAEMSLHLGKLDKSDTTIVYAAQAADVRADNGKIVGAFVLKGEPLAWGLSKKGFCASINGKVTIGVAENSPLFEQATEQGGCFFRQYPLVDNGRLVDNEPKGKAVRRGICSLGERVFMVETVTRESFHDFAQALVDLGVEQAVYLVGSTAYGWAVDENGIKHEFGEENDYTGRRRSPKNISYIVWRRI